VRRGGSVYVEGVQENGNAAEASVRFDNFQYLFNPGSGMGVQRFAGRGTAVLSKYNDGRWMLKRVVWNYGDYVTAEIEIRQR
jgi:hypothetical protein